MPLVIPGEAERLVLALYPELRHLLDLRGAGWRFLPPERGRAQVDGFRRWGGGWTDCVRIRSADDALGLRMDRDQRITWELSGSLAQVVPELLVLPHPDHRTAPRLARGRGPRLG
ncbi:hypothetical protein [Saccharothrix australiensis]|uniref:Uncharacterized protein n=1 Tax=Saccharothrix australiensis TaxID=2072 RepID=A0A495W2I6_9PSEU|nr:hypothetical protein [Saccharothrix australiensis]RKT55679.1 hypothetical protein C8E97_4363 [Saccharothrix australiensis]